MSKKPPVAHAHGFALVVALIFLLVLTVLAMLALSIGTMQTRIAGNAGNSMISFESSEGALRIAQGKLLAGAYSDFAANANGLYTPNLTDAPLWTTVDWSGGDVINADYTGNSNHPTHYIVEELPSVVVPGGNASSSQEYGGGSPQVKIYRITSRAVGADGKSPTLLQSLFHG